MGPQTWASYRNRLWYTGHNGSFDLYRLQNGLGPITFARDVVANRWYVAGLSGTWKEFWIHGPT